MPNFPSEPHMSNFKKKNNHKKYAFLGLETLLFPSDIESHLLGYCHRSVQILSQPTEACGASLAQKNVPETDIEAIREHPMPWKESI